MEKREIWGKRSFCLITGASRGIGQSIALKTSTKLAPGSVLCLLAKPDDSKLLEETKQKIDKSSTDLFVFVSAVDLGSTSTETFRDIVGKCLVHKSKPSDFEVAMIFHNAGSIGDTNTKVLDYTDADFLIKFYKDNLISAVTLNSAFFHHFYETPATKVVVNMSSLFGIQPTGFFGAYCSVKAARNIFFKVMAKEEPDFVVLNFTPGHVETDMLNECRHSKRPTVRNVVAELDKSGLVLTPEQTVDRLIKVLEERKFRSGQNVDYFGQSDDEIEICTDSDG